MIEEKPYYGYNAYSLSNDKIELIIPRDVGPRVLFCGFKGGKNLFHNVPDSLGNSGENEWILRGGHRLWHSPEHPVRTYELDNSPIEIKKLKDGNALEVSQGVENNSGLSKTMVLELVGDSTVKVTHILRNERCPWEVRCAPWALTVMEHGGYSTIPLPPKGEHPRDLLPTYTLVPWSYTDLSTDLWDFHSDFIGMDTEPNVEPQKLGITNYPGWAAYWQEAGTFVKYAKVEQGAEYPDYGCVYETFCNDFMIELETLGKLQTLEPGDEAVHVEYWGLFEDLPRPSTDLAFNENLRPTVDRWIAEL